MKQPAIPQSLDTFGGAEGALTVMDVKRHVNLIQQVLHEVMKPNVHYGIIPGTKENTLYKAGAELILTTFRLGCVPETVEETGDGFRVIVRVFHIPTGNTIGYGIGACSWAEEKYVWRKAHKGEYEKAPDDNKRIKYYGRNAVQQVRTNPADYYNTTLKMATKRARVDACLTSTAASDVFAQDLEDTGGKPDQGAPQRPEPERGNGEESPDTAKLLKSIELAASVDELTVIMDAINKVPGKGKLPLITAYRERIKEVAPDLAG